MSSRDLPLCYIFYKNLGKVLHSYLTAGSEMLLKFLGVLTGMAKPPGFCITGSLSVHYKVSTEVTCSPTAGHSRRLMPEAVVGPAAAERD